MDFKALRATLAIFVCGISLMGYAVADPQRPIDVPAGDLKTALDVLSKKSGVDLVYRPEQVKGIKTSGVHGALSVSDAIAKLLEGTGLELSTDSTGAMLIAAPTTTSRESSQAADSPRSDQTRSDQRSEANSSKEAGKKSSQDFRVAQVAQGGSGPGAINSRKDEEAERDKLSEIVVTGTHIRGMSNKTNPVIVIDRAQIERSGYSSTQDLFRSLPQNFGSGGVTEDGILTGNPAAAINKTFSSGIDLRGLGPASTLVLLNGHRLAPSAFGTFVDVSQVPLAAVERVEILTDGSSAIYGSDAVAGVVNIILKKDYKGADSLVRYGATADGGRDELLAAQTLGTDWSTGNIVGTAQFQRQNRLPASDRAFASQLPEPNDLLPQTRSYSAAFDGHQSLSDRLDLYADLLLAERNVAQTQSDAEFAGKNVTTESGDSRTIDFTPGLRYTLSPGWSVELSGLYGLQRSNDFNQFGVPSQQIYRDTNDNRFTEKSLDLVVNGHLPATRAGAVGFAIGASYRTETLDALQVQTPLGGLPITLAINNKRHVSAAFAELHAPLVSHENSIPLVETLELSAALRRDDYSDFGSTTNPHFGLRWQPWPSITLRASYGKSFRAPSAFEESSENPSRQYVYTYEVPSPSGAGVVPILQTNGSKALTPERARTLSFGLEYGPSTLPGLTVGVDYYDIRFQDRIIQPPSPYNVLQQLPIFGSLISQLGSDAEAQAIINAARAAGSQYSDFTSMGSGAAGVRYYFDDRQQNAALVRQSGFDLTSRFTKEFGEHTLTSQVNVGFTDKIKTQFTGGAAFANLVNTYANPPKWRGRVESGWSGKAFSISGALNSTGSYVNTTAPGNPAVAAWNTVDLNATWNADSYFQLNSLHGVALSLTALNVTNRDPPHVVNATGTYPVNYDAANANALGRFVALTLRKRW